VNRTSGMRADVVQLRESHNGDGWRNRSEEDTRLGELLICKQRGAFLERRGREQRSIPTFDFFFDKTCAN
jgi:hypothetical protein